MVSCPPAGPWMFSFIFYDRISIRNGKNDIHQIIKEDYQRFSEFHNL